MPKYSCLQVCCQSINLKMAIAAETCSWYLCNKQHISNHQIVVFDSWLIQLYTSIWGQPVCCFYYHVTWRVRWCDKKTNLLCYYEMFVIKINYFRSCTDHSPHSGCTIHSSFVILKSCHSNWSQAENSTPKAIFCCLWHTHFLRKNIIKNK